MSAPSGIKVPQSLASAFSAAQSDGSDVRALVFVIEGVIQPLLSPSATAALAHHPESFKHLSSIPPKGSFKDDMSLLPAALPSQTTPASFAYRLDSKDGGQYEWMMITFVPDTAGVRAKMLQASSRAGLLKALGGGNFKHEWFANSIKDLTPAALSAHLTHLASPAPLSAAEKALQEVREAEAIEAKRASLDPDTERRRIAAVTGLGGKMKWDQEVVEAMQKVGERSDEGWIVILEIPATNAGAVSLVLSSACTPSQLAAKVPAKSPSFIFCSFPTPPPARSTPVSPKTWKSGSGAPGDSFTPSEGGRRTVATQWKPSGGGDEAEKKSEGGEENKDGDDAAQEMGEMAINDEGKKEEEQAVSASPVAETAPDVKVKGRVVFIYSCPSGSPVKLRMVYSTSVRGVQQDAADKAGVEVVGKLETSDPSDLTESQLRTALPSGNATKPQHSNSLPNPGSSAPKSAFGAPAPAFGGAFGRPRPVQPKKENSLSSLNTTPSQIPLPASNPGTNPGTPAGGESADGDDGKEGIRRAFDAFGPRVGGGGGSFARPKAAGRR